MLPLSAIARIKEAVNLPDLAREYAELRKSGPQWLMFCPSHSEQNASCRVYEDHWYCYTCQARGDCIDLIARFESLTKGQAIRFLANKLGIPLDGKPVSRRQRVYDAQERESAQWWQKKTVAELELRLTLMIEGGASDETCEWFGSELARLRNVSKLELPKLATVATDAERREWRASLENAENVAWMLVAAMTAMGERHPLAATVCG